MSETLFIPVGEPIPATHWKEKEFDVPAIDVKQIRRVESNPIDISSHDCDARVFIPGPTIMTMRDGGTIIMDARSAMLAIEGGGRFQIAYPNPEYDEPLTEEQYDTMQRIDAENAAYDWRDSD